MNTTMSKYKKWGEIPFLFQYKKKLPKNYIYTRYFKISPHRCGFVIWPWTVPKQH